MIAVGVIILIAGIILRVCAMRKLGANFTLRILAPNKIVKRGIYKHIRHPGYAGGFIMFAGLGLLCSPVGTAILTLVIFLHFILDRIDREEQFLISLFGQEYLDYMQHTKMLIPFVF